MPVYEYKAINESGQQVTGTFEAANPNAVFEYLDKKNMVPVKVNAKKGGGGGMSFSFGKGKKISSVEKINFTKQLVTLLKAGVPIISCLEALAEQTTSEDFKRVLDQVKDDVESGSSFSDALGKHPKLFDDLYVNSVKAGEAGGVLDQVLERIGSLMAYEAEIKQKVKGAIRYPIIVIVGIVIGFALLMTMVVPRFKDIFDQAGVELPLPTRILLGISAFMQAYWFVIVGAVFGIFIGFRFYIQTPVGRKNWDAVKLKIPVFGKLFLKTAMSRFAHMFETLNKSGLPILQTMSIVSKTIGNVIIGEEIDKVGQGIEKGKGIARPLQESKLFPPLVVRMIAVGEQSGSLDEMLKNVSDHYDNEVNYLIENLVGMIEPILTVTIGAMILLLALGIFLPMWDMMQAVG